MYQKYQTEALVLSARETGESDRTYALFTKDFGLVRARASAVRTERSKMRYALQSYSRATVLLVKGKRGWRAAGALPIRGVTQKTRTIAALARISELVLRLVHGQEKNEYLYAALAQAHEALQECSDEAVPTIEIVCVARVLFALGYISAEAHKTALFAHTAYAEEYLKEADAERDTLLASINRAIAGAQL